MGKRTHIKKPTPPTDWTEIIMASRARNNSKLYEIKIPKLFVWTAPFIFAGAFALVFTVVAYYTHPPRCIDFQTQADAQRLFLADPQRYAYLDHNRDGVACNGI